MAMMNEWWRRAACLDADPELFFPISAEGLGETQVHRAKAVCAGCPVREPCLVYALETRQVYGVWGGMDSGQRRSITRRAARRRGSAPAPRHRGGR